jgi:rhodanese-related sulfurtransferase
MSLFKEIDANALKDLQKKGQIKLVDVRTDAEVAQGKIPGAVHIQLNLLPGRMQEFDANVTTVIYCLSGGRSAQACGFLANKGFKELYNLQGGIKAWIGAGLPVE